LNVVSDAKVQAETEVEEPKREPQSLAHLATAGKLIREEKFKEAEKEANAALEVGGRLDAAFVMGEATAARRRMGESSGGVCPDNKGGARLSGDADKT
jgi:hypothetical protein